MIKEIKELPQVSPDFRIFEVSTETRQFKVKITCELIEELMFLTWRDKTNQEDIIKDYIANTVLMTV